MFALVWGEVGGGRGDRKKEAYLYHRGRDHLEWARRGP